MIYYIIDNIFQYWFIDRLEYFLRNVSAQNEITLSSIAKLSVAPATALAVYLILPTPTPA